MEYYAGIDVSLESASLCVVDATGRIVREAKVASEPETLIEWFRGLGIAVTRTIAEHVCEWALILRERRLPIGWLRPNVRLAQFFRASGQ
jgi:hypothetical protein